MMETYYQTLGLYPGASPADIEKAYRTQSRDLDPEKAESAKNAYETIRSQEKVVTEVRILRKRFAKKLSFTLRKRDSSILQLFGSLLPVSLVSSKSLFHWVLSAQYKLRVSKRRNGPCGHKLRIYPSIFKRRKS